MSTPNMQSEQAKREQHERFFAFTPEERAYLQEGLRAEEMLLSPYATRHSEAIYEHSGGHRSASPSVIPADCASPSVAPAADGASPSATPAAAYPSAIPADNAYPFAIPAADAYPSAALPLSAPLSVTPADGASPSVTPADGAPPSVILSGARSAESKDLPRPNSENLPTDTDLIRPPFVRDVDRVLNNAFYNRCMDKTQVFPFYQNDDLTRRAFHLQLVSRISRKVAQALRLNVALTEAIALAHDMGHTPFGHGGERMLNDLYRKHAGRCFNHNVHGVRLLRDVATCNLSLQTYNGILCHCGEKAFERYEPAPCETFDALDAMMEHCYTTPGASQDLRPSTLEGCVVRICDILAYLGKDRQDALTIDVLTRETYPVCGELAGETNAQIIQNVTANIVKNSIGKPYLAMDPEVFESVLRIKDDNTVNIYQSPQAHEQLDAAIRPMMGQLYERFRADVKAGDESSFIFRHHINSWVMQFNDGYVDRWSPDDIVVDYIASMTDDYFIDLFNFLYPDQAIPRDTLYHPYFVAR